MMDFALMEERPRLQSVTFFVKVKCSLKFKVEKSEIRFFTSDDEEKIIKVDFLILPGTVSTLVNDKDFLAFRLLTSNADVGSFKAEILSLTKKMSDAKIDWYKIEVNVKYNLVCKQCNALLSNIIFDRVLPLPNTEQEGWFCHGDNANNVSVSAKKGDLLYSTAYFLMHNANFSKTDENIFKCIECASLLGSRVDENSKIWFSKVKFVTENKEITSDPLKDTMDIIRSVFKDNILSTVKIIFECGVNANLTKHLLIWVLEKDLKLRKWTDFAKKPIELNAFKVSYKCLNGDEQILKDWMKSTQTYCMQVSETMMEDTLAHLEETSKMIPTKFRIGQDQFQFGYLLH